MRGFGVLVELAGVELTGGASSGTGVDSVAEWSETGGWGAEVAVSDPASPRCTGADELSPGVRGCVPGSGAVSAVDVPEEATHVDEAGQLVGSPAGEPGPVSSPTDAVTVLSPSMGASANTATCHRGRGYTALTAAPCSPCGAGHSGAVLVLLPR